MKNKKTDSNTMVLFNAMSTMILYGITFVSAPVFSRILGTSDYGIVQTYNAWAQFVTVIIGLNTRSTLSIAKVNLPEKDMHPYQSSVLGLSTSAFLLFFLLALLFQNGIESLVGLPFRFVVVMLLQCFGQFCVAFLNTVFTYEMNARINMIVSVLIATANFTLSYFFILAAEGNNKFAARIFGSASAYIVAGFIAFLYIMRRGKCFFDKKYWKFCFPLCLPMIFHGIAAIICASSDRIMISKMIDSSAVGIYTLACNFAYIMDSIWTALHNSWDPIFMNLVKSERFEELKKRSQNYITLFSCLTIGFIMLTPEVYRLFAEKTYWEGMNVIPWIVFSIYATFIYSFGANYEFAYKKTNMIAIGSTIAGISNIILNFFLITNRGYLGAAIATLLSNCILAAIHLIFAKRIAKVWIYDYKFFLKYIGSVLLLCSLFECNVLLRWTIAIITGLYMIRYIYRSKQIF